LVLLAMAACAPDHQQRGGSGPAQNLDGSVDASRASVDALSTSTGDTSVPIETDGPVVVPDATPDASGSTNGGSGGADAVGGGAGGAGSAGAGGAAAGTGGGGSGGDVTCGEELIEGKLSGTDPCVFLLPRPSSGTLDYGKVNVRLTTVTELITLPYVADSAACDSRGGWYYDVDPSAGTPSQIILCPASCARLKATAGSSVFLNIGCRTLR
jgi:hypothetical protein